MSVKEVVIHGHRLLLQPWTYGQKQAAMRKVSKVTTGSDSIKVDIDAFALQAEMLLATIVEWDLKDERGHVLPITLDSINGYRPAEMMEEFYKACEGVNSVSLEDRKKS